MNGQAEFAEGEAHVAMREYDDGTELLVADIGAGRNGTVDVVGETAIVVTDDDQYEFELPAGSEDAQAFIKNSVLSIEVDA